MSIILSRSDKTDGTFGLGVLEPSKDPVDVPDFPPSISSLWVGLAVVIGLMGESPSTDPNPTLELL